MVTLWTPLLRGNFSLENSERSRTLHMTSTYGKQNLSLSAALNNVDKVSCDTHQRAGGTHIIVFHFICDICVKVLLKRQVMLKVTHQRPKSPTTEMELEGVIEVLRRDNKMYQKSAMIKLRSVVNTKHLLCLIVTNTIHIHVRQTALPDLPSHSPPVGDLYRGPPERLLHPGVESPSPQQQRDHPPAHHRVPPTKSFCESL